MGRRGEGQEGEKEKRMFSNSPHPLIFPPPYFPIPPPSLLPTPYSLLPTPYSLLPTPYSLLPTPYSLLPTPYSLLPTPFLIAGSEKFTTSTDGVQPSQVTDDWANCCGHPLTAKRVGFDG